MEDRLIYDKGNKVESPFFEVKNICKSFNGNQVLKNICFSLNRGEVLAVLGESGGGKTTLLRCINSLETADSGCVCVNGKVVGNEENSCAEHFGLVFQQFNLFPQYTVKENVQLAPVLRKKYEKQELEQVTDEILKKVDMFDKKDFYPWQLSGGQQQRVAIARALALNPEILCFDEPTSSLDPLLTGEVLKVIRSLKSQDRTMIIVTHEIEFARECADRIIFIRNGKVELDGPTDEVFGSENVMFREFIGK